MLDFHEQIVGEVIQDNGIVVMAGGLGLPKVLASILRLHSAANGLILILASNPPQREYVVEELQALDTEACPLVEINNEYTSAERVSLYNQGGTFVITARILIVDMLNEKVPLQKVAGIIVCNCHKVTETCAEAFILRLYRQSNKTGFIKGFTDKPQQMVAGFGKTERVMKSLFVRKLSLWPRFQLAVSTSLESHPPEVIDIRMPLTSAMEGIQNAVLEVMDACLKEMKKTNRVDIEELTVENGLFKSFDEIIRRQLDPIWHTVGRKTKQLVNDLKTLRKVAEYLQRYDAVTFLRYLDNLRMSEGARSVWLFAAPTHRIFELAKRRVYKIIRDDSKAEVKNKATAKQTQAAQTRKPARAASKRKNASESGPVGFGILDGVNQFTTAKRIKMEFPESGSASSILDMREDTEMTDLLNDAEEGSRAEKESNNTGEAQGIELEVIVEEMPKWKILREVLEEIEEDRKSARKAATEETTSGDAWSEGGGAVLVACKDERTCLQLNDCIVKGPQKLMREEWNKYLLSKVELQRIRQRSKKPVYNRSAGSMGVGVYNGMVQRRVDVIRETFSAAQQQEQAALLAAAAQVEREIIVPNEDINKNGAAGGRGRGRGKGKKRVPESGGGRGRKKKTNGRGIGQCENKGETSRNELQDPKQVKVSGNVLAADKSSAGGLASSKEDEVLARVIEESHGDQGEEGPGKSVPAVHYYALESKQRVLDLVKPQYVIIYDPDMSFVRELEVYKAEHPERPLKVYFLIYEDSIEGQKFEASIRRENHAFESLIRLKASLLIPVDQDGRLLDIRDPTQTATGVSLTPSTRKAGGRRIEQKQMQVIVDMREFGSSLPCVLHQQGMRIIPVTLESASDVGDEIMQGNIVSKLSLLILHFPRLRVVWSRSLHATADIFASLKANQDEPDLERAMRVGVPTEDGLIEGDIRAENFNTVAVELLRRLPGVSDANYRSIMDSCKSLADLALMPVEKLAEVMGGQRPARMLREFLDAKCPVL
ncbi:hypothetical protein R1sor_002136 [Riccia sorocarpa]|uniref:ERCC4 domain-containing protein n=1 Tax=Riccia sorocarpa TaxID=122646 RepID=A0ABD3H1W9_9MARC